MYKQKPLLLLILLTAFFITGNLVGAGILGLPIQAGFTGFFPFLLAVTLVGGAMLFTGAVLGDEAILSKAPKFHYPSLYQKYLGTAGKWVAVAAALIIYYGFIIAYLSGATAVIEDLLRVDLPNAIVTLIFFVIVTGLTIMNPRVLRDYTAILVLLLLASLGVLVFMAEKHVVPGRLDYVDWRFMHLTVPILVTAFSFHVIIPNIAKDLKWKKSTIMVALFLGALLGYAITVLWVQVSLGVLPVEGKISISSAYYNNVPSTIPLSKIIKSPIFLNFSLFFALLAIVTSYLTNGYGLMEFIDDLLTNYFKKTNKLLVVALSFLPPLALTLIYPKIFLVALDYVGAFGVAVLFGILPCMIAIIRARASGKIPILAIIALLIFISVLGFKVVKETRIIKIQPGKRYVRYNFDHYVAREERPSDSPPEGDTPAEMHGK